MIVFCRFRLAEIEVKDECKYRDHCIHSEFQYCPIRVGDKQ